jgi:hypothetical protein
MFKKAKILDADRISTPDFIDIVEKYHSNGQGIKLFDKLSDASFKTYCKANSSIFEVNREIDEINAHNAKIEEAKRFGQENDEVVRELPSEEEIKERIDGETVELHVKWHEATISQHIMHIKGAEIVFFEFKEILFDMARKLKDQIEPKTGKMTVVLKKFIEEWLLRRLTSFVKFRISPVPIRGKEASRSWPESQKDVVIREKQAQMRAE